MKITFAIIIMNCSPDDQMLKECEALYLRDPNVEDVKDLRHFIPLFRKICYIARDDIEKKFKRKYKYSGILDMF